MVYKLSHLPVGFPIALMVNGVGKQPDAPLVPTALFQSLNYNGGLGGWCPGADLVATGR